MAPTQASSTTANTSRSANACEQCRKRKVKCSGDHPCRSCVRHRHECTFGSAGRRRYTEEHVQKLMSTIQQYEEQLGRQSSPRERSADAFRGIDGMSAAVDGSPSESSSLEKVPDGVGDTSHLSPATATEKASGPAFESRVRSLFHNHSEQDPQRRPSLVVDAVGHNGTPSRSNGSEWCSTVNLIEAVRTQVLPTEAESHRLFELFLSYMGGNQHFLDTRSFSDHLTLLFEGPESRSAQMSTTWFIQYLLVMAMGKLMDDDTATSSDLPGAAYFAEAMRRLPPLHKLGECGVTSVEILCLVTTYLQWCDRRHDAYLYIGTAVRLAIALGCSSRQSEQRGLPSEKAHRNRVWWTAYMLDRRLSAALGLPAAADNRQIDFDLPTSAPGFQSPRALNINVRIAQATGDIMTSLYGNDTLSDIELVRKIQSILKSLHETGQSIPRKFVPDFSQPRLTVSRTGASLYLMLFQAVILCIRPLILQKVKNKVDGVPQSAVVSNTANLCHACTEAAIKSIQILSTLQKQNQIARFGFFDLDATFSAAFILIMKGFIHGTAAPPSELEDSVQVLKFLTGEGNKAAAKRLEDVKQLSSQVWSIELGLGDLNGSSGQRAGTSIRMHHSAPALDGRTPGVNPMPSPTPTGQQLQSPQDALSDMPSWDGTQSPNSFNFHSAAGAQNAFLGFDLSTGFGPDLDLEAAGIYSSYNDPTLPLTGVDHLDWAEMEKMFASRAM